MKKGLSLLLFLLLTIVACAQNENPRKAAERMAQRANGIVYELENQNTSDSLRYFRNIMDAVDYSLKSDEYDRQPNKKGEVKLRHDDDNQIRLANLRPMLIDAGLYLVNHRYRQDGINAWKLYIKASKSPLLAERKNEDESALAACYIAQAELKARNYKTADRYADMALADDDYAQYAAEIKAQCMHGQMVTHEDSVKYLSVLAQLYKSDPSNNTYFAWLMQFYNDKKNPRFNLENFINVQLKNEPNSPISWILKGETAMRNKKWDEAIESYKHADELDNKRVPVVYNIGICLVNKAVDERSGFNPTNKTEKEIKADVESLYSQARSYLERVRTMDPKREKVDWVTPLYRAYMVLGDETKAEELRNLVKRR